MVVGLASPHGSQTAKASERGSGVVCSLEESVNFRGLSMRKSANAPARVAGMVDLKWKLETGKT